MNDGQSKIGDNRTVKMMKQMTVVRVFTDARHPIGLGYSAFEAELADRLIAAGVGVKLYSGKPNGSIQELSRQLARTRSDFIVFKIDPFSAPIVAQLSRAIRGLRAATLFGFISELPSEAYKHFGLLDHGAVIFGQTADEVLAHPFWDIAEIPSASSESLYRKGILNAADLDRVGFRVASATIEDDLIWLSEQRGVGRTVRLDVGGVSSERAQSIIARVGEKLGHSSVVVQIPADELDLTHVSGWPSAIISSVVATTRDGASYEATNVETAAKWAQDGQLVGGVERGAMFARNGTISDYTGIYPEAGLAAALVHLDLSVEMPAESREQVYEWAGQSMALKSALVMRGDVDVLEPMLDRLTQDRLVETGGWPSHVYAIADHASGAVWFDGEPTSRFPLEKIGYADFLQRRNNPEAVTIVQITSSNDVAVLRENLALLHTEGHVEIPAIGNGFYFENVCRWLIYGGCRLSSMSRIQIDAAGQATACRDAGHLGDLTKSYDRMVVEARQAQQIEQSKRNCSTCPVRDACSRCAYLPDEWGGSYCEIRQANPATALFFELHLVADRLSRMLGIPGAILTLKVSAQGLPRRHISAFDEMQDRVRPVIITVGDQHIAWQRGTARFLKLSAPLATILEGYGAGAADEQLTKELSTRYGVEPEVAAQAVHEGRGKLAAAGIVNV